MPEIKKLIALSSLPGIKRDGTMLDSDHYTDGQWVRFQRGRPKKMGGFSEVTSLAVGPIRQMLTWSRSNTNNVFSFSPSKAEMLVVDNNGFGSQIYDRTPGGFTANDEHIWTVDTMFDDAVGSDGTIIITHPSRSYLNIDDQTATQVYYGLVGATTALSAITGLTVSGGVCAVGPYLVYYGSDGLVGWTDVNQPQTLTGGDAGSDRVTGAKIVKGLPVRSNQGPAALLWSLDSLILMQWVGGDAIFRFTTISSQSSVLSQNSIIEYDGAYFWIGIDRFMAYSGGQVAEVPNQMNLDWFFDSLDINKRQKVWALKVPRFGEIWWFYPRGDSDVCSHAVILNVREKTWYDVELGRSAGYFSQVFQYPVMADSDETAAERLTITTLSGSFNVGDNITGTTSNAVGIILSIPSAGVYNVRKTTGTDFSTLEDINNLTVAGTGTLTAQVSLYKIFVHEKGKDAVTDEAQTAIESYFTTSDLGLPGGGPVPGNSPEGLNRFTRLTRIEQDFVQEGDMTLEVLSREFANGTDTVSGPYTFTETTDRIDVRTQNRHFRLKFTSDTLGGSYEMGRTLLHTEAGDGRS